MRLALIAAVVISAAPAWAQAPSLLYVGEARWWDPASAASIEYALPLALPVPAAIAARVDGGAWMQAAPVCDSSGANGVRWCHLPPPAELSVAGLHRVEIANGLDASPVLLLRTLDPPRTICPYVTLAGVSMPQHPGDKPLTAYRQITSDVDFDAYEQRVAQLRAWGLQVEDQRHVFSAIINGRTVTGLIAEMAAWCVI